LVMDGTVELLPFSEGDFDELLAAVPDAGFLLQWAGPQYVYPLDRRQLEETVARTKGPSPRMLAYKAVLRPCDEGRQPFDRNATACTVGHIQLLDIDRQYKTCVLGRVLIFPRYRGRGLGRAMVAAALQEALGKLALRDVTLAVFDFNRPALAVYHSQGFTAFDHGYHEFAGETWAYTRMALSARDWRHRRQPSLWKRLLGRRRPSIPRR
jgi:RimJ/RimL family protein N-acetyltransferase